MKESYECELATHIGPESCGAARKGGVEALQYFNVLLEPRGLFCRVLLCHIDKLTPSRMETTTFLRKSV